jgi:hypothetical protein
MPDADFAKWPKLEEIACGVSFLRGDDAKLTQGAAVPVYGDRQVENSWAGGSYVDSTS